jgi:hypothetical protein
VGGGTNSEVVQPGSGGSRRGSGEGTAAGTAVTVGSRTQSAVSESRGVVGRIMDRLVPSRVAAGTGSPSSPSAVAPAPSGASVRVVPGATTAASSNGAAAAQGFVSVTATNSLPVVLVDGVPRGVAPAIVRVAGGSHRVEVRAPGMRFRPATITVGVTAGDTAVVAFWRIP